MRAHILTVARRDVPGGCLVNVVPSGRERSQCERSSRVGWLRVSSLEASSIGGSQAGSESAKMDPDEDLVLGRPRLLDLEERHVAPHTITHAAVKHGPAPAEGRKGWTASHHDRESNRIIIQSKTSGGGNQRTLLRTLAPIWAPHSLPLHPPNRARPQEAQENKPL